jgi:preprotein translocase subunit YajC
MLLLIQAQNEGNPLIFFVLVFAVFWFFMIRPQVKKQKQERKFRQELQKGNKVVTNGGIHGKVSEISDATVVLEIAESVKIKVDKNAIVSDFSNAAKK